MFSANLPNLKIHTFLQQLPNCMLTFIHVWHISHCNMLHVLALFVWGCCLYCFVLPDSGGCARKRAAMSVTLTAVKRVQSSPNLLASGITTNHGDTTSEWLFCSVVHSCQITLQGEEG